MTHGNQPAHPVARSSSDHQQIPLEYGNSSSVQRIDLQLGDGYNVSQAAVYAINDLMSTTFTVRDHDGINDYVLDADGTTYMPGTMERLYHSSDMARTFASLAKSMAKNIRSSADNGTVTTGKAGTYLILIKVRGWYLALPTLLTLGRAVFLAISAFHTHKQNVPVWGTNALPIIALGGTVGSIFQHGDMKASAMDKVAKRLSVMYPRTEQHQDERAGPKINERGDYEMVSPLHSPNKRNASPRVVSMLSNDGRDLESRP